MDNPRFLSFSSTLFELTRFALIIVVLIIAVVILVGTPLLVKGESMVPNFQNGQVVIVEHVSFSGSKMVKRGDVVAAKFPADPDKTKLIKRIIGLPGETVEIKNTHIFINGQILTETYQPVYGIAPYPEIESVTLKTDEYFLAGDNRIESSDSRLWGPVTKSDILGRVSFIVWPPSAAQFIDRPTYN